MTTATTTSATTAAAPVQGQRDTDAAASLSHPSYRPDIDGLRAVAVLSVVFYHAFPASGRGGFVGVDVFFVISGFLISTIIAGNLARGTFSFGEFYVRRIKRIFPALLLVLAATFAFGWWALLADEYEQLGKHVAGGAGFVANLVFWNESGYFDNAADTKPLLHLWSLGIEEQFYIFWPVIACLAWRLRLSLTLVTVVTAVASFALNVYLVGHDTVADFYSPFTRYWELSVGSALACIAAAPDNVLQRLPQRLRDLQSLVGAVLLGGGLLVINATSAFPGWWALLPTFGTALLIAAGSQAWLNRTVLANRVVVWFGLISFPLYLWHWPILSFIRILAAERPTRSVRFAAIALAIALAWATWKWVERPIRTRSSGRRLPLALLVAMIVAGCVGFACYRDGGFAFRSAATVPILNPGEIGHDAFYAYPYTRFTLCQPASVRAEAEVWNDRVRCFQSRPGPIDLAIIGDSHAEHLFAGLAEQLPATNIVFYTRSSLPISRNPAFAEIFRTVVADANIKQVILSSWWTLRATEAGSPAAFARELEATVDLLTRGGKTVYLADDVPNFSFSPRLCKYQAGLFRIHKCTDDENFYNRQLAGYADVFTSLAARSPAVRVLKTSGYFCDRTVCSMNDGGRLLFRDSDHLGLEGSRFLARHLIVDYPELGTARERRP